MLRSLPRERSCCFPTARTKGVKNYKARTPAMLANRDMQIKLFTSLNKESLKLGDGRTDSM